MNLVTMVAIFASTSTSASLRVHHQGPNNSTREIRLLMVRHGLSCANIISEYGGMWKLMEHKNYPDPLLSDCGVSQTMAAADLLADYKIDWVGSSVMLRAIETAWLQFKKRTVHVIPHVAEEAHGLKGQAVTFAKYVGAIEDADNTPLDQNQQKEILKKHYPDDDDLVDFTWANATNPSSWQHFEEFLESKLLPSIIPADHKGVFTIGIASHSLFLEAALGKSPKPSGGLFGLRTPEAPAPRESICHEALPFRNEKRQKPDNNQILELHYNYEVTTQHLELNLEKKCRSVGGTVDKPTGVPGTPVVLCEADIQRCIPGWSKELTCKAYPRTVKRVDSDIVAPGECATHHECNSEPKERGGFVTGYTGFPYIATEEQKWADSWRKVDSSGDDPKSYPRLPDLNEVCQCVAQPNAEQTCLQ